MEKRGPFTMCTTSKLTVGALILTAAYLLKSFYSSAGSEDLAWIIGPTAWMAELISTLSFSPEPGYGWVDAEHGVVIAPVCAGVNFLIISLCMSSFQILCKKHPGKELLTRIVLAGAASYLLTVIANALRIVLAVALFSVDIYNQWLTLEMVHRVAGITLYYLLLCSYSMAINRCCRDNHRAREGGSLLRSRAIALVPLICYLLFAVGVPLARSSFNTDSELFRRHAVTVCVVTVVLTLMLYSVQHWYLLKVRKVR
jgi:exosortase K